MENVVMSEEVMSTVILSYTICLALGAFVGLLATGLCAAASDKPSNQTPSVTPMINECPAL
jgi:hypothetical protein